jgi:hypothetical protein
MVNLDSTWKYRLSELANYRTIQAPQYSPKLQRKQQLANWVATQRNHELQQEGK